MLTENMCHAAIEAHKRQYEKTDFDRCAQHAIRLTPIEKVLVGKYFQPGLPTLEIGCAMGRFCFALERELGFRDIVGIDFVERSVEEARRRAAEANSIVDYQVADAMDLPFPDESFGQAVCLSSLLGHLPYRQQRLGALQEWHRVLKDGGLLLAHVLNVDAKTWRVRLLKLLTKTIRQVYNPNGFEKNAFPRVSTGGRTDWLFLLRKDKPVIYHYDSSELVFDFVSAGFEVVQFLTTANDPEKLGHEEFKRGGRGIWILGRNRRS